MTTTTWRQRTAEGGFREAATISAVAVSRKALSWPSWGWLLAAALVLAFAFNGSRGLWEPDEGRYVDVALEMLRSGDLLVPHLHHELIHLTKPPLTYWALAGCVALFGRSEWAVRLPNALAFVFTVLLVFGIGRRLAPRRPWLPAAIYATSLLPFLAANVVTTDTLLALWEALAVYGFVAAWWDAGERRRWPVDLMWLGFALAFLTKGPPGLLPAAAIAIFAATTQGWRGLRRLVTPEGLAAFAVIGLGWYLVLFGRQPAAWDYLVRYELIDRIFTGVHKRHPDWYGPIEVYVPTFLLGTLPWALLAFFRRRRSGEALRQRRPRDPRAVFLLLWLWVPLVVFCLARSRLPLYVLPIFPPLALLVARRLPESAVFERRLRRWLPAWIVLLVAFKAVISAVSWHQDSRPLARAIGEQVQEPFNEIVFVDTSPRYSLAFYLDLEVEPITLDPHPPPPHPFLRRMTLSEELAEPHDEQRLFVVKQGRSADFEKELARCSGNGVRRLGGWEDLAFYSVTAPGAGRG